MKKLCSLVSVVLSLVIVFTLLTMPSYASESVSVSSSTDTSRLPEIKQEEDCENYDEFDHSLSWFLYWYDIEQLRFETVDNVDYIYIVENGEASILNVHLRNKGPEKKPLIFPDMLGGYPVTRVGDSENCMQVFWFIEYDEEIDWDYVVNYGPLIDYDPLLPYVSKVVFPEGYEYIEDYAMQGFNVTGREVSFPKSLKEIGTYNFDEYFETCDPSESLFIFPECYIDPNSPEIVWAIRSHKTIIAPSRDLRNLWLIFSGESSENLYQYAGYNGILYLPSNVSAQQMESVLFVSNPWVDDGKISPSGFSGTIHCAPDCEWLEVIDKYTFDSGFTYQDKIVTDVTPAESIAFDSDKLVVQVGQVKEYEAKTYPAEAIWTACDYVSSNPDVVKVDAFSGRITALKEGTATITATHCERGFTDSYTVEVKSYVEPEPQLGATGVEAASEGKYYSYGNRDYAIAVNGSPDKVQLVRPSGSTVTFSRSQAQITENEDGTETWVVTARLNAGEHAVKAKYGKTWTEAMAQFTVEFDVPSCYSFTNVQENGVATFTAVTDPVVTKIQIITQSGSSLTYGQSSSYIGEDGLRYWTVTRRVTKSGTIGLRIKYGSIWSATDFTLEV